MLIFKKVEKEKKNLLHFRDPDAGFLKRFVELWVSGLEYFMEMTSWLHFFFLSLSLCEIVFLFMIY